MTSLGFNKDVYIKTQTEKILERVSNFERLYLEFGGKLCYDMHAARVLPGYEQTTKVDLLKHLGDIEILYCVSARDIEKGRVRRDFGLTYDNQTLKDISDIEDFGLHVKKAIITLYDGQPSTQKFKTKLENFGMEVYVHTTIDGYPNDLDKVMAGFKELPYIETEKKLVLVTGVGGGSGKMATCLSQIAHERSQGHNTGFAKFETFPIWNLELDHPVNVAYEAATADLLDVNMIDPYHLDAYGVTSINYNRDVENFNILTNLMKAVTGEEYPFGYKSPTDMGVNAAKAGIVDDEACQKAAKSEIIRRYFRYYREKIEGIETQETLDQMDMIMKKVDVSPQDRNVVGAARAAAVEAKEQEKGFKNIYCGAAIEVADGTIVQGKNSPVLHAESAAILNAVKVISNIPDEIDLISPEVIKTITDMKRDLLNRKATSLNVDETLVALAISSSSNPMAKIALDRLKELEGNEMHITHLPKQGDEAGLSRLKMNVTTDAKLSLLPYFQD